MRGRNIIIVGIAVLFGLIAVFLANSYFSGIEQRNERIAEVNKMARIVVATQDLAFGTPLQSTALRMANWPANAVPQGAFTSVEEATRGGRVALRPIVVGEPILASKVSGSGGRATLSAVLPKDARAVAIPIDAVSGVGGFVRAGDVVDVLLTRQIPGDGATSSDQFTTVVLENVPVLAIDQVANEDETKPVVGKTATIQTDAYGAQKIALATKLGALSLTLRNVENQQVGGTPTVLPRDLGQAGMYIPARSQAAPRAPAAAVAAVAAAPKISTASAPYRPSGPTMQVVRGVENQTYEVKHYGW